MVRSTAVPAALATVRSDGPTGTDREIAPDRPGPSEARPERGMARVHRTAPHRSAPLRTAPQADRTAPLRSTAQADRTTEQHRR
ncbi:hypothetical protein [Streptomyces sp. NPDC020742]|uniref:hypothetical protein n=1 Tax=Streptomyces sp. NPDC020742 TaxID=3154897 RepID=UPI0033D6DD96